MFKSDVFSRKENKEIEQRTAVHQQVGEGKTLDRVKGEWVG